MLTAVANNKVGMWIPMSIIKGGKDEETGEDEMIMEGLASDTAFDTDGESLNPSGFNYKPLMENGFVNWHHLAKYDPEALIGEPIFAKVTKDNKFWVRLKLFNKSVLARKVYNLQKVLEESGSKRRLGLSLEGDATSRSPLNDKIVLTADVTHIAITPMPKNKNTYLQLVKGKMPQDMAKFYDTFFQPQMTITDALVILYEGFQKGEVSAREIDLVKSRLGKNSRFFLENF